MIIAMVALLELCIRIKRGNELTSKRRKLIGTATTTASITSTDTTSATSADSSVQEPNVTFVQTVTGKVS